MHRWEERELPHHNWTKFIEAKRKELQRLNNAYKNTLSNAKVELLQGFGKIVDAHTVDVDGTKYTVSASCSGEPSGAGAAGMCLKAHCCRLSTALGGCGSRPV